VSEKIPSRLLPEVDCITVLRKCERSRYTEAIRKLTRKYARFSFSFGNKFLWGTLERSTLCLLGYSNVEVKTAKKWLSLSVYPVVFCDSGGEAPHILFFSLDVVCLL